MIPIPRYFLALAYLGFSGFLSPILLKAQPNTQLPSFGVCKPVSERTTDIGCWIIIDQPVGRIDQPKAYWHLDVYPTKGEAEKAKGPRGTLIEALGKIWLLTIETEEWRPALKGERVGEIGPLPVKTGEQYSALFMETVMTPGMSSAIHTHSGPEAWYTMAGETCLEIPSGKLVGRPGGPPVIVPGGLPMLLTATGTEQRRGLTLILHESAKPPTTVIHEWTPKGLCGKAS